MRDVLAWFGALVAPTSVYLSSEDFSSGEPSDEARYESQRVDDDGIAAACRGSAHIAQARPRPARRTPPLECQLCRILKRFIRGKERDDGGVKRPRRPAGKKNPLRVAECQTP